MFEIFKPKRSLIRKRIQGQLYIYRTWFEWTIENGRRESTLVVEVGYELDPRAPNHYREGLDEIIAACRESASEELPPDRLRVIPRMYGL